jgi:hypothetical protein
MNPNPVVYDRYVVLLFVVCFCHSHFTYAKGKQRGLSI